MRAEAIGQEKVSCRHFETPVDPNCGTTQVPTIIAVRTSSSGAD